MTTGIFAAVPHGHVLHTLNRRRVLLAQRALIENAIGSARTVGEVWRLGERLDAIDRQLAGCGSDGRP